MSRSRHERMSQDWIQDEAAALADKLIRNTFAAFQRTLGAQLPAGFTLDLVLQVTLPGTTQGLARKLGTGWKPKKWITDAALAAHEEQGTPAGPATLTDDEAERLVWHILAVDMTEDELREHVGVSRAQVLARIPENIRPQLSL